MQWITSSRSGSKPASPACASTAPRQPSLPCTPAGLGGLPCPFLREAPSPGCLWDWQTFGVKVTLALTQDARQSHDI